MLARTLTITFLYNDAGANEQVTMTILDNGQPVQNLPNTQALALAAALNHYSSELINAAVEGITREEAARQAIAAQEALDRIAEEDGEGHTSDAPQEKETISIDELREAVAAQEEQAPASEPDMQPEKPERPEPEMPGIPEHAATPRLSRHISGRKVKRPLYPKE